MWSDTWCDIGAVCGSVSCADSRLVMCVNPARCEYSCTVKQRARFVEGFIVASMNTTHKRSCICMLRWMRHSCQKSISPGTSASSAAGSSTFASTWPGVRIWNNGITWVWTLLRMDEISSYSASLTVGLAANEERVSICSFSTFLSRPDFRLC